MRSAINCLFLRRLGFDQIDVLPPVPGVRGAVVQQVALRHGLTVHDLQGYLPKDRVAVRDEAVWRLRQTRNVSDGCPNSYPALARYFGLMDHTSILAAERRHAARIATPKVAA
jgi:chromosomal replication initiation ATPase DnaA